MVLEICLRTEKHTQALHNYSALPTGGAGAHTRLCMLCIAWTRTRFITDDQMLSLIFTPNRLSKDKGHIAPTLDSHTLPG